MIFEEAPLQGAYVISPQLLKDERGFFTRSWCENEFREHGIDSVIKQCNISYNEKKGTLRGMHYQIEPSAEAKLVRCTKGEIYDVIIDIRPDSPTFLQHFSIVLNEENRTMLFIPKGFAHGFQTLRGDTEVFYQMSDFFAPGQARGIRWDDPVFGIEWPHEESRIMSDKDAAYPDFNQQELEN